MNYRRRRLNPTDLEVDNKSSALLNSAMDMYIQSPSTPEAYKKIFIEDRDEIFNQFIELVSQIVRKKLENKEAKAATAATAKAQAKGPDVLTLEEKKAIILTEIDRLLADPKTLEPFHDEIKNLQLTEEQKELARSLAAM